jgi:hypothetical protein
MVRPNTVQRGIVSADLAVARLRLGDPAIRTMRVSSDGPAGEFT